VARSTRRANAIALSLGLITTAIIDNDNDRSYIKDGYRTEGFAIKISKEAAADNRQRIIKSAARLFRERGLFGVGVDELAAAAGLSSGSLYNNFRSKDGLTVEAVEDAFADFASTMSGNRDLTAYVAAYLSSDHRDNRGGGCVVATLGCEIPRQSQGVRASFTDGVNKLVARMQARLGPEQADDAGEEAAWMTMAMLVGTMILARAVDDPILSDRILAQGQARLLTTE
jgi:TetR/AcrR family transcriptional regulator, transcriptional repressor for nem operon